MKKEYLPTIITIFFFGLCFAIISRPFAVVAITVLLFSLIAYLVYYIRSIYTYKKYKDSIDGKAQMKLEYCKNAIKNSEQDIVDIRVDIRELENGLRTKLTIAPTTKNRTLQLIEEFKKELKLRELKIAFFETCVLKIRTILHNHQLTQKLYEKQLELQEMREKNYDDIAEMEELRTEFAYEKTYLDTIDELSNRMLLSEKISDAEHLTLELEALTHELREI